MAITVDTSAAPRYLRFAVTGEWPTSSEQRAMHGWLMRDGLLTPQTSALIDVRGAAAPGFEKAREVARTGADDDAWPRRCAFLVSSNLEYGFTRQLSALAPPDVELEIFSDLAEAEAWLRRSERNDPSR